MTTTEMLKIQFYDCYNMLKELVEVCPEEVWSDDNHGLPIWNHVIHTIMGTTFWLRADYYADFSFGYDFPESLSKKLLDDGWFTKAEGFLTKEQMNKCFTLLDKRVENFWGNVNDDMLNNKIFDKHKFTYLSVIVSQCRHIMCHVGMCNAGLIGNGYDEVKWLAFGEGRS